MGVFDTIIAEAKCPHCGYGSVFEFQTKSLLCSLRYYKIGSKVETDDLIIKDGILKNCIERCDKCNNHFYADFEIKEAKIARLLVLKKIKTENNFTA